MTDPELIYATRGGDERAFGRLVERWRGPVYNLALRLLADTDAAADVTQRTFIKVHQKLADLKAVEGFTVWVLQIARNQCLDELKRVKRHRLRAVPLEDRHDLAGTDSADQAVGQALLSDRIQAALQRIPAEQREVVVMKELQQLSFPEIAAVLTIPVNTAKSRCFYGLKALHAVLMSDPAYATIRHEYLS